MYLTLPHESVERHSCVRLACCIAEALMPSDRGVAAQHRVVATVKHAAWTFCSCNRPQLLLLNSLLTIVQHVAHNHQASAKLFIDCTELDAIQLAPHPALATPLGCYCCNDEEPNKSCKQVMQTSHANKSTPILQLLVCLCLCLHA